jgi:hypothetical protein
LENSAGRKSPTSLHGDAENAGWGCTCLQILLDRSSDKLPSVRARSISNLAQAIEVLAKESSYHMHLQTLLGFITRCRGRTAHNNKMTHSPSAKTPTPGIANHVLSSTGSRYCLHHLSDDLVAAQVLCNVGVCWCPLANVLSDSLVGVVAEIWGC